MAAFRGLADRFSDSNTPPTICLAAAKYSRKDIDNLTEFVKHDFAAKGLVWFKVEADDGQMYVLRHDEATGDWELVALTRGPA